MPVITPQFEITVKGKSATYKIPAVKDIRVESSRKMKADRAEFRLPMMKGLELDTFQKNDEVDIKFGHKEDSSLMTVFFGYITELGPNLPVEVICEDAWTRIKNRTLSGPENFKAASYTDIASVLIGDVGDVEGIDILTGNMPDEGARALKDNFYVDKQSYEQLFDYLTEHSGYDFFVVPGTMTFYFGPGLYRFVHKEQTETPIFRRGLNIISSDLKWREGDFYDQVRVFTGDQDFKKRMADVAGEYNRPGLVGPPRSKPIFIAGVKDKDEANKRAKEEYDKLNANGFEGSFKTFGQSRLTHSMECLIEGVDERHKSDTHFIEKIVFEYGSDIGFKMDVSVDPAIGAGGN